MTDKEQIMIHGVDVSGCSVYKNGKCLISKAKCNARCDYGAIYLKEQLARKTQECDTLKSQLDFEVQQKECIEQECESLKEEIETYKRILNNPEHKVALTDVRTGEREVWRKLGSKADRYRKALEDIELTIKNLEKGDILTFPDFTLQENATIIINQCNQGYRDILDIINKAKGETNE